MMSTLQSIPTADRISDLPNPILCHILSFLPTKQAATTSVLSKRWKPVWLSVLALNFDDKTFKDFNSFRNFVYSTMFSLREKKTSIHSFTFNCGISNYFNEREYNQILKFVMQRGVKNLDFSMPHSFGIKLPPCILSLKTLQVLKLTHINMGEFDQVDFPCVKTLHLNWVYFISDEYIAKFLFGCPILEDLQLLIIKHRDMTIKNLGALPNLVKVKITDNGESATPIMALVCNAKILHVKDIMPRHWTELPMFHNLINLELSLDWGFYGPECESWLGLILPHFPKLQHFNIIQDCSGILGNCFECWNDPPIVAECVSLQLKTFCIGGYGGSKYEFGLAKYIMQHSKVLETISIKSARGLEKNQMLLKLSSCTIGSTKCKLFFD